MNAEVAPRIPISTYRLQFHAGFTFDDARKILDYLRALGISDIYASPYRQMGQVSQLLAHRCRRNQLPSLL